MRRLRSGRSPAVALLAALLAGVVLPPGCKSSAAPAGPPSVLLVSIDTLRPDHLGVYGYARDTSPNLDALAAEGVVFESAWAPSPWTLPSHATMLSGQSPFRHGAVTRDREIRADVPLLAEMLRERGYATAALVSGAFVSRRYGFARGFDEFVERARRRRRRDEYQAEVLDVVRKLPPEKFFLLVHYFDVHAPYSPPAGYDRFRSDPDAPTTRRDGRAMRLQHLAMEGKVELTPQLRDRLVDLYDGAILGMDAKLGELVAAVRERASGNVIVMVTSDHGEEFLEHGALMHTRTLYDEVLRVPLIVAGPGVAGGRRVTEMVSLLDVAPTVLALVDPDHRQSFEGRSLRGQLSGAAADDGGAAASRPLPLLTLGHDDSLALRGFRDPGEKLILDLESGTGQLYDLREDPGEQHNRYPEAKPVPQEKELRALAIAEGPELPKPDAETVESLRALGYL